MSVRRSFPLLAFFLVTTLAGCGGGGSDSTVSATGPTAGSSAAGSQQTLASTVTLDDGTPVGTAAWPDGSTASGGQGQAIGAMACTLPGASYTYAHLSIFQNGQQLAVPADIGVVGPTMAAQKGCVYPLHTDDQSGKIRIEASAAAPTLGQFFAIWGEPLSSTSLAGLAAQPVTAYVNDGGTVTQVSGDPSAIALTPGRQITLVAGTAPAQIPSYAWNDPPPIDVNPINQIHLGSTAVGMLNWPNGDTASGGSGAPVDGLVCGEMSADYHVHTHLAIYLNGQMLAVPALIGIPQTAGPNGTTTDLCDYQIHTHDASGVLHVETPTFSHFTLGQAFDIWGEPLTATNVAGLTGQPIKIYINDNGDVREYVGDPAAIELVSHRAITIQIGTPLAALPSYAWDSTPDQ